jgi:hypothetical protein
MPQPDLVICDPSPWDSDKAKSLNISMEQLSYIAQLLFPQSPVNNKSIYNSIDMDTDYQTLLEKFDNNPINLLNNVTKNCSQLIVYCQMGIRESYNGRRCCPILFSNVEYTLLYKCYSSGGQRKYLIQEASQTDGITVSVQIASQKRPLNRSIAGDWAIFMTGISVAVSDKNSNLYHVSQNSLKLLEPDTYNALPVEKKETDSSDKSSYFQHYKGRKMRLEVLSV